MRLPAAFWAIVDVKMSGAPVVAQPTHGRARPQIALDLAGRGSRFHDEIHCATFQMKALAGTALTLVLPPPTLGRCDNHWSKFARDSSHCALQRSGNAPTCVFPTHAGFREKPVHHRNTGTTRQNETGGQNDQNSPGATHNTHTHFWLFRTCTFQIRDQRLSQVCKILAKDKLTTIMAKLRVWSNLRTARFLRKDTWE